jgi:tetratricopeptide (TPR) repeat protein
MRVLILSLILAAAASAQSTRALQTFESGMKASEAGDHTAALSKFMRTLHLIERENASEKFFAKVHYNLGVSNYHLRYYQAARTDFEKALGFGRGSYEKASYALGLTLFESRDLVNAERSLRKTVILNHRNGDAWLDLANVYTALGNESKARRAHAKAIKHGARERGQSFVGMLVAMR